MTPRIDLNQIVRYQKIPTLVHECVCEGMEHSHSKAAFKARGADQPMTLFITGCINISWTGRCPCVVCVFVYVCVCMCMSVCLSV